MAEALSQQTSHTRWSGAVVIVVAALVAYLPALWGDFLWDDPGHVSENETLRTLGGLGRIWFEIGATQQYYPMVFTSFWLEYHLWGLSPAGYHVTNVLLHAVSAVLLWRLLRRLSVPGAFVAAAVFVLHPVTVESVAWITERKNALSLFFYLAAASTWVRFALPLAGRPRRRAPFYGLTVVLFLFAVLSKTVTCTFPAAAILVLWWKKGRVSARDLLALAPLFAIGIGLGLLTVYVEKTFIGAHGAEFTLTFIDRLVLAGRIPWFYASKLVWPFELSFIYPRWAIDSGVLWQWSYPLALLAVIVILWQRRRAIGRGPLTAVLFFVGSLFPALGFFDVFPMQFSYVADHFQYLAAIGLIPLLVAGGAVALRSLPLDSPLRVLVPAALLVGLGGLTFARTFAYRDSETLWRDTISMNPDAWIAHNNLGQILSDQGELEEALAAGHRARELEPSSPKPDTTIGTALYRQGKLPAAVEFYSRAVRTDPSYWPAHYNLANTWFRLGKLDDAREHYDATLELNPEHSGALHNLGLVCEQSGQSEAAAEHLRAAHRLEPDDMTTAANLARVLATNPRASRTDAAEAVALAELASRRSGGKNPGVLQVLAAAYARAGRFGDAKRAARDAIELASASGQSELVESVRGHLRLFEQGKPVGGGD